MFGQRLKVAQHIKKVGRANKRNKGFWGAAELKSDSKRFIIIPFAAIQSDIHGTEAYMMEKLRCMDFEQGRIAGSENALT